MHVRSTFLFQIYVLDGSWLSEHQTRNQHETPHGGLKSKKQKQINGHVFFGGFGCGKHQIRNQRQRLCLRGRRGESGRRREEGGGRTEEGGGGRNERRRRRRREEVSGGGGGGG